VPQNERRPFPANRVNDFGTSLPRPGRSAVRRGPWLRSFLTLITFSDDLFDGMGQHDTSQARALLRVLYGSDNPTADGITEALARWRVRADQAVARHWKWITAVAGALEARQRLTGDEIVRLNPKRGHAR